VETSNSCVDLSIKGIAKRDAIPARWLSTQMGVYGQPEQILCPFWALLGSYCVPSGLLILCPFWALFLSIAFEYHGLIHPIEDQHHDELGHRPISKRVRIEQLRQALTIGFHCQYLPRGIPLHER